MLAGTAAQGGFRVGREQPVSAVACLTSSGIDSKLTDWYQPLLAAGGLSVPGYQDTPPAAFQRKRAAIVGAPDPPNRRVIAMIRTQQ